MDLGPGGVREPGGASESTAVSAGVITAGSWHVHENTVGRLLGEAARRCGVVRQVTCHALRHTFAILALENGTDNCRCGASAPRALRAA